MTKKLVCIGLLLLSMEARSAIGDGDPIDFAPIPGEFCNHESDQTQQRLLKQFPGDMGIAKLYALYIGLCHLVNDKVITELSASMEWTIERDRLIDMRRARRE